MTMHNPNHAKPVLSLRGTTPADMAELIRRAEKALITFTPKQPADDQPPPFEEDPPWV